MKLTRPYPEFHVTDVASAAQFFEDLGFAHGNELREGDVLDFVVMESGGDNGLTVMLHHLLPDAKSKDVKPGRLYFDKDDVNALHASVTAEGSAMTARKTRTTARRCAAYRGRIVIGFGSSSGRLRRRQRGCHS